MTSSYDSEIAELLDMLVSGGSIQEWQRNHTWMDTWDLKHCTGTVETYLWVILRNA